MRLGKVWLSSFALAIVLAAGTAAAQDNAAALAGRWEGSYVPKTDKGPGATRSRELGSTRGTSKIPVTVMIGAGGDGKLTGTWTTSSQQAATPIEIAMEGDTVRFTMSGRFASSWEGKLSADGSTLDGNWQGKTFGGDASAPLVLKRSKK